MSVGVHTRTGVSVQTRSTVWTANEIGRSFLEISTRRGIHQGALHENLPVVLNGLRVWITTHKLRSADLEIWQAGGSRPVERYDLALSYDTADGDPTERFETRMAMLEEQLASRPALPAGSYYRLIVELDADAPSVPGWSPTQLGDVSHLTRKDVGKLIDTAAIGVTFATWL